MHMVKNLLWQAHKQRQHYIYQRTKKYKHVAMCGPSLSCCSASPKPQQWTSPMSRICMRVPDSCTICCACLILMGPCFCCSKFTLLFSLLLSLALTKTNAIFKISSPTCLWSTHRAQTFLGATQAQFLVIFRWWSHLHKTGCLD